MKRILSSLLILLMIITMVPVKGFAIEEPNLVMVNSNTVIGKAGDTIKIPIELKNTSSYTANDITATLSADSSGMVYVDGSSYKSIGSISGGRSKDFDISVKIDELAENRTYSMTLNVVYYSDTIEDEFENELPPKKLTLPSETINVRVSTESKSPQLVISRVDIMPASTINPGDNLVVGFELENKGDGPAKDIKVNINGLTNDGFSLQTGLNNKSIPTIESGKKNYVYFELKSSKRLSAGNYELGMILNYKDIKNVAIKEENNFYVGVNSNSDKASSLLIQNLSYPTGSLGQNKEVIVTFQIKNQGQTEAKNIVVKAESVDQSGLVPKSVSLLRINSIAPNATETVTFNYLTTKTGETKNYPIDIRVEYTDDLISPEKRDPLTQFIGVFAVAPDEDANQSTPKLIIDKYNFEPALVRAGENFTMNLSFYNTNSTKTVKNIKIFLTSNERTDADSNSAGGSVFTPVDSSNTFYIDSIPPKGRVEKSITMFTVPDAAAKTYTLTANFEYEDNAANPFEATELIGVPVIQQSKLEVGEIGFSPEAYIGQSTPISLEFFNTGKVTLYNMMVKIDGDFQTENGQLYIGNFTSGSSEYFEGYVIPNAPGELKGELVFSYEDSTGQEQEIRKEFNLNVMDMPMEPEFPGGMPPMEEAPPKGGIAGIFKSMIFWAILAIIAVIGGIVVFKKKKKKKLEAMEIDD